MSKRLRTDDLGVAFRNLGLLVVTTCQQELECQAEDDTRSNPLVLSCHSRVLCECLEGRPPRLAVAYLSAGGCSQRIALILVCSLESVILQLSLQRVISGYGRSVISSFFRDATPCRLVDSYGRFQFSRCDRYVVPKCQSPTTNLRCITSQKNEEFCVFISYSLPHGDDEDNDQNTVGE
jgi:hypothetical protein